MCLLYRCHSSFPILILFSFFFNDPPTTEIYTLSLHDALPISMYIPVNREVDLALRAQDVIHSLFRSEEHTSELQSPMYLVCRLLLEKKKKNSKQIRAAERLKHYRREDTSYE